MKARFSQKMVGERKAVMEAISHIIHQPVVYTKAPRFAYETGQWSIDREGLLTSPVFDMESGALFHAEVMGALAEAGFAAEGTLCVTVCPEPFDAACLGNLEALLAAKATLIRHALGAVPIARLAEDGFELPFFPAALDSPAVLAALQFSMLAMSQAASQKQVRAKERPVENEKYAMRCFLLRIGMIGPEYAVARKELLRRLPGDSSFKSGVRAPRDGPAQNCTFCYYAVTRRDEKTGAFTRWFCDKRQKDVSPNDVCEEFRR